MKNKILYLPKFQNSGTFPESTEYYGGNLNSAKISATLSRDQWNNLYKQGKISLSQIPRKYQSWIEGENSNFKKDITNAINNFGTNYVAPTLATALSFSPVIGSAIDIAQTGFDLATGNLLGAGLSVLPGNINKIKNKLNKIQLDLLTRKLSNTPEFKYRVQEHVRNTQLQDLMNYGENSNILVHGDPAGIGVSKIKEGIVDTDGLTKSFPHFKDSYFVPGGKSNDKMWIPTSEKTWDPKNWELKDRPIFWGDGQPFFETRVGNTRILDNDDYAHYLATKDKKYRISSPNEFILDSPYRYIATHRESVKSPIVTQIRPRRDMTEIQTGRVPIDKIWGIEWGPLTQTWGKTIYSINGTFHKKGGKLNENN